METFLIASLVTALCIKPAIELAKRYSITDNPLADSLKIHTAPIPCIGGLAMLAGSISALIVAESPSFLVALAVPSIISLCLGMMASWFAGFIDDTGWQYRTSHNLFLKILSQIALAGLMIIPISILGVPLVFFGVTLWISYIFISFLFLAIINAANMQDGLDGLLAGIAFISGIGFFLASLLFPSPHELVRPLSLILAGTTSAFLLFNWNPARLFMGDNGSYLVGFFLAFLLFFWGKDFQYILSGLLIIGMPLANEIFVIIRRLIRNSSPLSADRHHIYDIIHRHVGNVKTAVLVNYGIHAMMVGAGIALLCL